MSKNYDCQECGRLVAPLEYHPYWYCVLQKAGQLDIAKKDISAALDRAVLRGKIEELRLFKCRTASVKTGESWSVWDKRVSNNIDTRISELEAKLKKLEEK